MGVMFLVAEVFFLGGQASGGWGFGVFTERDIFWGEVPWEILGLRSQVLAVRRSRGL